MSATGLCARQPLSNGKSAMLAKEECKKDDWPQIYNEHTVILLVSQNER